MLALQPESRSIPNEAANVSKKTATCNQLVATMCNMLGANDTAMPSCHACVSAARTTCGAGGAVAQPPLGRCLLLCHLPQGCSAMCLHLHPQHQQQAHCCPRLCGCHLAGAGLARRWGVLTLAPLKLGVAQLGCCAPAALPWWSWWQRLQAVHDCGCLQSGWGDARPPWCCWI